MRFFPTVLAACALLACASQPATVPTRAASPERLFPMTLGSAWSYDVNTGDGEPVLAISRVVERTAAAATIQGGEGRTRYELRPDGIFRSEWGGYLLRGPLQPGATWPAGGGRQARITRTGAAIVTPAGDFQGCVEVEESGAPSGALIATIYCPDVGPVEVRSTLAMTTGTVVVSARLRGFQIGPAANAPH